jgi:DNA helicase IV
LTSLANPNFTLLGFRLKPILIKLGQDLERLEENTSRYRAYTEYLQQKDRTEYLSEVKSVLKRIHSLQSRAFFATWRNRSVLRSLQSRTYGLKNFLEDFDMQYVRAEVKRRKSFFDRTELDEDQKAAVAKDASHHLVLAAAGSGKTRALTARIALLVERGVPTEQILALAYTKTAAAEMETRLKIQYGISARVSTLHSFSRRLARQSSDFRSGVAGGRKQRELIQQAAEHLASKDRAFAVKLLEFAVEFKKTEEKEEHEFPSAEQYYNYLSHQKYTTLNLVHVKSIAEREIGNFLFLHRVRFVYEPQVKWSDRSPEYRDYQPDFFLPDYDLWIEHWACDRNGKVPHWFSSGNGADASRLYRQGMEWKRNQFKKHNQKLLESFHYQWVEGTLIQELRRQLEQNHVAMTEMPLAEIIQRVGEEIRRYPLYDLIFSFITKGKTNGLGPSDVSTRLSEGSRKWTSRQKRFASLILPIWKEYERLLEENNMLDFNDMVDIALQVSLKQGSELSRQFQHVLIDEFQDITDPQLRLIQSISSHSGNGNTLFCVGDHRQSIFSFAGADVHNILEFEERFPYSERTPLSTNYRCPSNIVRASNELSVDGGLNQRPVVPASKAIRPIYLVEKSDDSQYGDWELKSTTELLTELLAQKGKDEEILVLARFNFRLQEIRMAFPDHAERMLKFASIHRAKGKEADYVLLLGCIGGKFGFPSTIFDESLVQIVDRRAQDANERLDEERRLFYVALTRCKKQLYIFTSNGDRSQFISEIKEIGPPAEGRPGRASSPNKSRVAAKHKAYAVEVVREEYPKAYAKWDPAEDQALTVEFRENLDIKSIAKRHGRQRGAIRSRLKRLGLIPASSQ